MTKYNDFFMLAGKDRRVIAKRASRHVRNRFGYAAVNRNKIQDVPAENRGKNRFCHMAARKHRFEPAEMKKPQPAPVYGLLAGREKRMIGSKALRTQ